MCNVSVKVFIFMYEYSILIEVNVTVHAFQIFLKVKPLQILTLNFKLLFFCSCFNQSSYESFICFVFSTLNSIKTRQSLNYPKYMGTADQPKHKMD